MVALQLRNITITCHLHFHPFSTLASGLFLWCAESWPASEDHYVQLLSSHQHLNNLCLRRTRSSLYQTFGNKNLNLVTNLQRSLHMLHFDAAVFQDVLKYFNKMLENACSDDLNVNIPRITSLGNIILLLSAFTLGIFSLSNLYDSV